MREFPLDCAQLLEGLRFSAYSLPDAAKLVGELEELLAQWGESRFSLCLSLSLQFRAASDHCAELSLTLHTLTDGTSELAAAMVDNALRKLAENEV